MSQRNSATYLSDTTQPSRSGQKWGSLKRAFPILLITLLLFCGAAAQSYLPTTDPARYQCYALTFWLGSQATHFLPTVQCSFLAITTPHAAFRMLPLEYPPLTLLLFSLPLLFPIISYQIYQIIFSLLMSLLVLYAYWLLQRNGPRGSGRAFMFFLVIGACAIVPMRYDLLPATLTLLSLIAAHKKHWTSAYIALAIGVLLKIYPILLFPALFIAEQQDKGYLALPSTPALRQLPSQLWRALRGIARWQWRNSLLFFAILILITGLFALSDFNHAVVSQLNYFLKRPIQIESMGASLIWLTHLGGIPWNIVYDFGSVNMYTELNGLVAPLFTGLFIVGVIYIFWLQWQQKIELAQTVTALTLIFIATGKVFSPQYLIWLIPLLAYTGAYSRFWILTWGAISFLTTFIYIVFYSQILDPMHITIPIGFFEVTTLRNILLAFLTLCYLFNWFHARKPQVNP